MTDAADNADGPFSNPNNRWANRTAGASDGTSGDDTLDCPLIEYPAVVPRMDLLDLAAGSGYPSVTIAAHMAGNGSVTAYDLTYYMMAMAQGRVNQLALAALHIVSGDMGALPFPNASFDATTCRNGLILPNDKLACVIEARRVLRPGAKGIWVVWSAIHENPTFLTIVDGLKRHFKEDCAPRMIRHSLGEAGTLSAL